MDWEKDDAVKDPASSAREFTLHCNFTELELLTTGIVQLHKAISEGQEIAYKGDLTDMDKESKDDYFGALIDLEDEFKKLWEVV